MRSAVDAGEAAVLAALTMLHMVLLEPQTLVAVVVVVVGVSHQIEVAQVVLVS